MLVTSDVHAGLVAGDRRDPARRDLAAVSDALRGEPDEHHPKASWPWVRTLLHSVYDQPYAKAGHDQHDRVLDALSEKLPAVAEHLDAGRADALAFTNFPKELAADLELQPAASASTARSAEGPMS